MSPFLALPQEITEQALINTDVKDVTSVSQVCQALRRIVYGNESHVWRGLFLKIFDDPRKTRTYLTSSYAGALGGNPHGLALTSHTHSTKFDWRGELQRRITARKVLLSPQRALNGKHIPRRERVKALNTIVDMVLAAVTVPPADLPRSYDIEWVEGLLTKMDDAPHDEYGLYNPSPPSDLKAGRILDGDSTGVFPRRPNLFTPRPPLPMGPRRRSASLSFLDDHIPYTPQSYFPPPPGHPLSTLSPSLIQTKDSTEDDSDHENNNDDDDNIDREQYSLARERVLRARLRLLRGYSDRQKALVPIGHGDSQYDVDAAHSKRLATDLRLYARARVYDLRRYSPSNEWGPLIADAAVEGGVKIDWEQVEAVLVDAGMNIFDHIGHDHQNCPRIINPFGLESSRAYSAPGCEAHTLDFAPDGDWAGITGNWSRLISFCDYRDLRSYNELLNMSWPPRQPHSLLADPQFSEAVHVLSVRMRITEIGDASTCHPAFPNRPRLGIAGDTRYNGNDMSKLVGYVSMTPEGAIRWDFCVSLDGQPRWSSVGVQIGEAGSANGVIGIWTGVEHEPQDPAGPFWFWKVE